MQEGWGLWEVLWLYVLLREHGMLWNTGGKNQVKNVFVGFGRHMGLVSAWDPLDAWFE